MGKDGWIKLHRKLLESDIFCRKPPEWLKIWIYILLSVNFDDGNLPRGTGYFRRAWQDISSDANSESKITQWQWHNCIRFLKEEGMITTQKTTRGMRLKVLKYQNYQIPQPNQSNTENKTQARRKQDASNTILKELKNVRKKEVNRVFAYWQKTFDHSKAKLTQDRKTKIASRLRDYSLNDLKRTIDGCKNSSYHQGENDQGKVYDSIELLFRNGDKVESFWQYTKNGVGKTTDTGLQFSKACAELGRLAGKKRILDWLLVLPEKKHGLLCKFLDRAYRQGHSYSEAKDEWRNRKD